MKLQNGFIIFMLLACFSMSSCTFRLVDFTVISSKNVDIGADRSKGKVTEGSKAYFLGFGWNIKDALDIALESAGNEYDMLIDGVVSYTSYPFVVSVKVKGTAMKSSDLRASLGEAGYEAWCKEHNVFNPDTAKITKTGK